MIWNIAATLFLLLNQVQGHGMMVEPKSRNYRAYNDVDWNKCLTNGGGCYNPNVPWKDDEPWGLSNARNTVSSQCGVHQESKGYSYDTPLAWNWQPLPWQSQAFYQQGSTITVKIRLTVRHQGYFQFYACPRNQPITEACFKQNPLTIVRDNSYGTGRVSNQNEWYDYSVKLPSGLSGDALIQWIYYTDNGTGERFWNCAEVTIGGGGPVPPPTSSGGGTCGNGNRGNGVCSNGQCCSQYGWCGTTPAHCGGVTKLADWSACSSSSQCSNGCCTGKYSGGTLKCTPLGSGFNPSANGCVSRRRLRGNETLVDNE